MDHFDGINTGHLVGFYPVLGLSDKHQNSLPKNKECIGVDNKSRFFIVFFY
jgi:hypothetical protein